MLKYSICLPVYNGAKYIEKAIQSVLDQEYLGWELIVYDNGSTDGTSEIVLRFNDSRIKLLTEKERVSRAIPAWHKAMSMATGDYVLMLGHDDWFKLDFLKIANDNITGYELDVFSGWTDCYDQNYKFIEIVTSASFIQTIPDLLIEEELRVFDGRGYIKGFLADFEMGFSKLHLSTTLIRRTLYEKVGGFNTELQYCAESELYLKLAHAGAKIGFYWGRSLVNYIGEGNDRRAFFMDVNRKYHDFYKIPKIMLDDGMVDKKHYDAMINSVNKRAVIHGYGYSFKSMLTNINKYTEHSLLCWNVIALPIALWVRIHRGVDYIIKVLIKRCLSI